MNCHRFISGAAIAGFMALASLASGQRTIVIDAGHGGHDRGGVPYQRIGEKGMTLDVSQRLKRVLQAQGYRVVMTRNSDVFVPLGTRVAIANSYRGATFVSVHFNSSRRAGANGVETYYYRSDSASLAASIHRNVVAGAPTENRGIRRRGFFGLRRTRVPSVSRLRFPDQPGRRPLAQSASFGSSLRTIARGNRASARTVQSSVTLRSSERAWARPAISFGLAVAERRPRASKKSGIPRVAQAAARKKPPRRPGRRRRPRRRSRRVKWNRDRSSAAMRAAEESAFANGVEVEALRTAPALASPGRFRDSFLIPVKAIVFAGKGHNGGDALVPPRFCNRLAGRSIFALFFPRRIAPSLRGRRFRRCEKRT